MLIIPNLNEIVNFNMALDLNFSKPQMQHMNSIVSGIIGVQGKKNVSNLNRFTLNSKDRSCTTRFLNNSPWDEEKLRNSLKNFVYDVIKSETHKNSEPIFISIDDTLITKSSNSKKIEGMGFIRSHVTQKSEWAHCIVSAFIKNGGISYPLDFDVYLKEELCDGEQNMFKTKHEIAISLLEDNTLQLEKPTYVLADSWYISDKFINQLQSKGYQVIGALRSNRIIYPQGIRIKLSDFRAQINPKHLKTFKVNGRRFYTYRYEGPIKGIENCVVVLSWIDEFNPEKSPKHIISTDVSLSDKEIISYYGNRWEIETNYRNQKENLGLDHCEMRSLKGIKRFWRLVYTAYVFLCNIKFKAKLKLDTLGDTIKYFIKISNTKLVKLIIELHEETHSEEKVLDYLGFSV